MLFKAVDYGKLEMMQSGVCGAQTYPGRLRAFIREIVIDVVDMFSCATTNSASKPARSFARCPRVLVFPFSILNYSIPSHSQRSGLLILQCLGILESAAAIIRLSECWWRFRPDLVARRQSDLATRLIRAKLPLAGELPNSPRT
jgi:hypothetical protein